MRRTVLILAALAALSCSPDGSEPLAPEAPQAALVTSTASVHGQVLLRSSTSMLQYRLSLGPDGGTITRVSRVKGWPASSHVFVVQELCTSDPGYGRFARMVVGETLGYTHEFWIRQVQGRGGIQLTFQEMPARLPPAPGIDPCDPAHAVSPPYAFWPEVTGGVRIGL